MSGRMVVLCLDQERRGESKAKRRQGIGRARRSKSRNALRGLSSFKSGIKGGVSGETSFRRVGKSRCCGGHLRGATATPRRS